ncbi:hypothetical protein P700755_003794 [Psychroflexus torquis ATCC 700755]|uniref:Uncharacterized protein n=1 Tax=Psychroflexus torquis (strain ATCC 700755 / CIP 106069 / ACAM 623) TaxID=313595 RepID=K4IMT5_PSYTT|nr:hypothetical protein [Psychroflexus torquis]AFU70371.1 hypothetical protein P700755_003794 [Psychroflexus torquis ATCC 700755]
MTLQYYDKKISELKIVKTKATAMRRSDCAQLIDDLETKRVLFIANMVGDIGHGLSQNDLDELTQIAEAFSNASGELQNQNSLIDNAIRIGSKLLALI